MTEAAESARLKRILIALDSSEQSRAALEVAARMAARLQTELVGLFVEDAELLTAASLPGTRIVRGYDSRSELIDATAMARAVRVSARRAQATLVETATRLHVKASFRIARGEIAEQVLIAARQADIVALGAAGRPAVRRTLSAKARLVAARAGCSVLLSGRSPRFGQPVTALYQGAERTLEIARHLAAGHDGELVILTLGGEAGEAAALAAQASEWLARHDQQAVVRPIEEASVEKVYQALEDRPAGVLVVNRQGTLAREIEVERTLAKGLACSVLVLS